MEIEGTIDASDVVVWVELEFAPDKLVEKVGALLYGVVE